MQIREAWVEEATHQIRREMMIHIRTTALVRHCSRPILGFIKRRNFSKNKAPWEKAEANLTGACDALGKVKQKTPETTIITSSRPHLGRPDLRRGIWMRSQSRSCRDLHQALKIAHHQLRRVKVITKPISSSCQISNWTQIRPLFSQPFTSSVSSLILSRCLWSCHLATSTQRLFHSASHL
jgi:hypothetical protein